MTIRHRRAPYDPDQQMAQAIQLLESGQTEQARQILDAVLKHQPEELSALLYRGQVARDAGDLDGAFEYWRRIGDRPPNISASARFLEAAALIELGRVREAERKLRRAVELHPSFLQPQERLLALYVLQRRRPQILEQLDQISQVRALTLDELVLQSTASGPAIGAESAIPQLEAFAQADPRDVGSRLALARYYRESERLDEAVQLLRELLERDSANDSVRVLLAECLRESGEPPASGLLEQVATPTSNAPAEVWRAVGQAALERGDAPRAVECFRQAVALDPDDSGTQYQLGLLLQRLGDTQAARRNLEQAVRIDRLQAQAHNVARLERRRPQLILPVLLEVAQLQLQLGRNQRALSWYSKAVEMGGGEPALAGALRARQALQEPQTGGAQPVAVPPSPIPDTAPAAAVAALPPSANPLPGGPRQPAAFRLRNVQGETGLHFQYYNGDSGFKYLIESMGGGVAVLDYDGDGWPDLYFLQGCALPYEESQQSHLDRLFRNLGDGTFQDVTAEAGVLENRYGQGCAAGDWDNDGFVDLVIANYGRNTALRNNGDGTFTDVTEQMGLRAEKMSSSAALADLDRDGDLDLYVVNYVDSLKICRDPQGRIATCHPANFNGEQDTLYVNRGEGTWADVTQSSGIVAADGKGLGIVVSDLDGDGWPDIYVANDGTPNFLFLNTLGGTAQDRRSGLAFSEQGLVSGAAVSSEGRSEAGMGIACADLNGDLQPDLFVTNFYQESNTLYLNQGGAMFADATRAARLAGPSYPMLGFGTQAVDLDLDGRQELFVANGHIDDREGEPWKMTAQLFASDTRGAYYDASRGSGAYFAEKHLGRGVARLDWNRDGRPDLVVVHQDAPPALLSNETPPAGHAVVLELQGVESNRDAIGAKIRVVAEDVMQQLEICGGDGYYASNERRQFVGLGSREVDALEIDWPSGRKDRWQQQPADCVLVIIEGQEPRVRPLIGRAAAK